MPDRFTDEDRARLEALGQYVDCEVALRALAHIDYLEKALREIAERPTCERNPDGVDQAAATMQLIAREALKGEDEARSGSAGSPEMGALACLHAAEAEKDEWQAMAEKYKKALREAEARVGEYEQVLTLIAARVGEYEQVLTLIATPKRPDGTYNRSREACEQLARAALDNELEPYQTFTSGTFGPSKAALKGEDG